MRNVLSGLTVLTVFSAIACGGSDPVAYGNPSADSDAASSVDASTAADALVSDANANRATDSSVESDSAFVPSDAGIPSYPGQAPDGKLLWGAAVSGNGDPVARHETPSGHPLTVHRTYFQWAQRATSMITSAKDDVTHHRVPWVSVKPPSWAAVGAGTYDTEVDEMLNALKGVAGPVWLSVHHEPEGGGGVNAPDDPSGPSGHLAMNTRVRARITALGVKNIALAPVLMSYTYTSASGRDPNAWWAPGIYDFVGIDHYADAEATLLNATWASIRTWAKAKGVDIAVGEWGMRGTDAPAGVRVHDWYNAAAGSNADGKGARVVGLAAFDSDLNSSSGGWTLKGEQLTAFQALLGDPRTVIMAP